MNTPKVLKFYKVKTNPRNTVVDFACVLFLEDIPIIFTWMYYEDFLNSVFENFSYNILQEIHYENMLNNFNEVLSTEIETNIKDVFDVKDNEDFPKEIIKIYKKSMPEEFL